jgi:hypothetical protein
MAKKTNMDEKAANQGDRLKHALLIEILDRASSWSSVHYAETHAGAGIYLAANQPKDRHIEYLALKLVDIESAANDSPGRGYLQWLKEWWSDPENGGRYPGSVVTVLQWLKRHQSDQVASSVRVTEADKDAFARLQEALSANVYLGRAENLAKSASFADNLSWLTERDNLVLLVDPFAIVRNFKQGKKGINDGWIDHEMLISILKLVQDKDRAVLSLWWSRGQSHRNEHEPTCTLLSEWAASNGRNERQLRIFANRNNHVNALIGIGAGASVVSDLPRRDDWKQSWLSDVVYER